MTEIDRAAENRIVELLRSVRPLATAFVGGITALGTLALGAGLSVMTAAPAAAATSSIGYHPIVPTRICDTRKGNPSGLSGAALSQCEGMAPGADGVLSIQVAGLGVIPSDAASVVLNVAAVDPSANGYLSVYPLGETVPGTSSVNFTAGSVTANLVAVGLSSSGGISIYNLAGSTNVVVDVEGYVAPETTSGTGLYVPVAPTRICDTRSSQPVNPCTNEAYTGGGSISVPVAGQGPIPANGLSAVVLSLTAIDPMAGGFLTAYPAGTSLPTASQVNYALGQSVANTVVVPIGANGSIEVYSSSGTPDIAVDVEGYVTDASNPAASGSALAAAATPTRICDTRTGNPSGLAGGAAQCNSLGVLRAASVMAIQVTGLAGVPANATAVMVNLTATDTTASSYLTAWAAGTTLPLISVLNWAPGVTRADLAIVPVGTGGQIDLYNFTGDTNVIVDVVGWFSMVASSPPLTITTTSLPAATVGSAYSTPFYASGGTPPYSTAIIAGSLPPGLSLSSGGIAGTPTSQGNFSFTLQVTDSTTPNPQTATATLSIAVSPAPVPPLVIDTTSLPGATVGSAYSTALTASGDMSPYAWVGTAGSLPPGLSLSTGGQITGTPTSEGNFSFTLQVTDSTTPSPLVATATLSMVVSPAAIWQSPNWSGYVVSSGTALITSVSGEWTVPTLNCSVTPNSYVATWVGIGGVEYTSGGSSGTLLQTGVTSNCVNGAQQNVVGWWYEIAIGSSSGQGNLSGFVGFPVSPGDSMEAEVYQGSNGAWVTRVDDLSTGLSGIMVTGEAWGVCTDGSCSSSGFSNQGSTANVSYSGGYTAEWIVEDPGYPSMPPLADYGTVAFSDLLTSLSSWSLAPDDGWEIVQGGVVLSTPSLPSPSGDGFSVSYTG